MQWFGHSSGTETQKFLNSKSQTKEVKTELSDIDLSLSLSMFNEDSVEVKAHPLILSPLWILIYSWTFSLA